MTVVHKPERFIVYSICIIQKCIQSFKLFFFQCEAEELEEFEILEELADDDVSFISNVSTVNKVVTHLKVRGNFIPTCFTAYGNAVLY